MKILREGPPPRLFWWEDARLTCGLKSCQSLFELEAGDQANVKEIQGVKGQRFLAVTCPVCTTITNHPLEDVRAKLDYRRRRERGQDRVTVGDIPVPESGGGQGNGGRR